MNFGNLKYAIGSSRAVKLSKSRGPSSNTEQTSTINLNTKNNVENLLSRKNPNSKLSKEKTEKTIDSNMISLNAVPLGSKNSKSVNRIQFISQSERAKENITVNNNNATNMNIQTNSSSLPRKINDSQINPLYRSKHVKTSSEIPRNIAMTNYIFENFNSNKSKENIKVNNNNANRDNYNLINDIYNNTTNTFNREKEDKEILDLEINSNTTNELKFHKNFIKSIEHKNFSKILSSEKRENKFCVRNVIEIKSEDEEKFESKKEIMSKIVNEENQSANYNNNLNEQILMNKELLTTVEILNTYIMTVKKVTESKKGEYDKKMKQKDEQLNKLKVKKINYISRRRMKQLKDKITNLNLKCFNF